MTEQDGGMRDPESREAPDDTTERSSPPGARPPRQHTARSSRTNWDDPEDLGYGADAGAEPAADHTPERELEPDEAPTLPRAASGSGATAAPGAAGRGPAAGTRPSAGPAVGAAKDTPSHDSDGPPRRTPRSERARHRRNKALISLLLVLLGLFFAFWFAYSYFRVGEPRDPAASTGPTCRPADPNAVIPSKVKVNVYNSTTRAGLAKSTSQEVANLGFVIGAVANDPLKRKIPGPAEIRFGPNGKAGADLIVAAVGKGAKTLQDKRKDASVDLVLGRTFTKLGPLPSPTGLPVCASTSPSSSPLKSPAAKPS